MIQLMTFIHQQVVKSMFHFVFVAFSLLIFSNQKNVGVHLFVYPFSCPSSSSLSQSLPPFFLGSCCFFSLFLHVLFFRVHITTNTLCVHDNWECIDSMKIDFLLFFSLTLSLFLPAFLLLVFHEKCVGVGVLCVSWIFIFPIISEIAWCR